MAEFETDDKLYCEIDRLELDWIKKGQDQLAVTRLNWIDTDGPVVLTCQCELAGVATAKIFTHQQVPPMSSDNVALNHFLDEL